MRFLKHYSLTR